MKKWLTYRNSECSLKYIKPMLLLNNVRYYKNQKKTILNSFKYFNRMVFIGNYFFFCKNATAAFIKKGDACLVNCFLEICILTGSSYWAYFALPPTPP